MIKQEDIAKKLNISRTTVARALNGSEKIKPETKEKILKLCDELGYVKNPISTSLATKKNKRVFAFLVKSKNKYYASELSKGLKRAEKEFKFYGYDIKVIETDINEPLVQINKLKNIMEEEKPDGVIIIPLLKDEVKEIINEYQKTIFITLDISIDETIPHVGGDYFKSGRITAEILINVISKGKKVLVLDTQDDRISSKLYLKGFLSRMNEEEENILVGPIFDDNLKDNITKILKENMDSNIEGIYSSRFLKDIVKESKKLKFNFKVVANGIGNTMKKLMLEKDIIATVVEQWEEQGYIAGKIMFNYIYKDNKFKCRRYITESKIIFREHLK